MSNRAITAFLVPAFFADYFGNFGPLGILLKFGVTLLFIAFYWPSATRLNRISTGAMSLVAIYLAYCITRFATLPSSTYEVMKLALALILVVGCINASLGRPNPALPPVRLETCLRRALDISIAINTIAVLAQVAFGNQILYRLGVPSDFFESPEKMGRYSGLILNLPLWSAMLFIRLLLADRKLFSRDPWHARPVHMVGLAGMLVLSGQKYVMICALLYLLMRFAPSMRAVLLVCLVLLAPLLGSSENYQIQDRVSQASQIVDSGVTALIRESDAEADYPQFAFLDRRLNSWLYMWANLRVSGFGRGLGTWGDFSASLNPELRDPVVLSESQWAHVLVEQGYGGIVLIGLASMPFLFANRILRRNLRWLGFFIFVAGWFTMGSSDYLWFFMAYALLFNLRAVHRPVRWPVPGTSVSP